MYNNETDLEEFNEQIELSKPKLNLSQNAIHLRRLMKKEKVNIERLKNRMKDNKQKEGEVTMSL